MQRTTVARLVPAFRGTAAAAPRFTPAGARAKSTVPETAASAMPVMSSLEGVKPYMLESLALKAMPENKAAAMRAAVDHRRKMYDVPAEIPVEGYPYERVYMKNCENVIGYLPIPIGVCGPLLIDERPVTIPFATTEGALISSINRGAKVNVFVFLQQDMRAAQPPQRSLQGTVSTQLLVCGLAGHQCVRRHRDAGGARGHNAGPHPRV